MSNETTFFQAICEPLSFGPFDGSFLTLCFLDLIFVLFELLLMLTFGVYWIIQLYRKTKFLETPLFRKRSRTQAFTLILSFSNIILPLVNVIYYGTQVVAIPWFQYAQILGSVFAWICAFIIAELEYCNRLEVFFLLSLLA